MEKLFNDSELFTKTRPTGLTAKQASDYYNEVAQEIIDNGWSESDVEDIAFDLSKIKDHNGYENAKTLETDGDAYYDINSEFVEFLDSLLSNKQRLTEINIKAWVEAHDIKPIFEIGRQLQIIKTILSTTGFKKDVIVFITGHNLNLGCYLVNTENKKGSGVRLPYEIMEQNCILI